MIEAIHEKIEVITRFKLLPKPVTEIYKIRWRGREYQITKLAHHHKVWDGRTRLHKFAISTNVMDFRITFDTENLF